MRISGGFLKGRTFYPPADKWPTRPTTDIAREGLFNILSNTLNYSHIKALDLFRGSGAHSYELISRGCTDVTYVDKFKPCLRYVEKTLMEFNIREYVHLIQSDYLDYIKSTSEQFDYIFAGPPYPLERLNLIPNEIFNSKLLKIEGLFVLEHNPDHEFSSNPFYWKSRNYGQTFFSFFKP